MTDLVIRGVKFENIGIVDKRLSVNITNRGRLCCPLCEQSKVPRSVGPFGMNRYFREHISELHYRCECGWIGTKPGQHVRRARNHEGPVSTKRKEGTRVRLSELL